jgi:NAD(P)-dependent dehydrogenase (short-subunit alcohol dehydrogenase family)
MSGMEAEYSALVSGATSGIGLEISRMLLSLGYTVHGLGRRSAGCALFGSDGFVAHACDVTKTAQLQQTVAQIGELDRAAKRTMRVLVNCAGIGAFGPHEQLRAKQVEQLVQTNLQAPLILTGLLLRDLKRAQGFVINISSITAKKTSTHGCAYAATKAGLSHFGVSLFEEVRKTGVKVVTIHPDMTETPFYDELDFTTGEAADTYITAGCVADAVRTVLTQRDGTVITELTVRPQRVAVRRK